MLMLVVVLLAACRGGTAETTVAASDLEPPQVVSGWLDALAGPDVAALEPLVEPVGLAVVAAVENDLRSDELVGLLTQGLSVDLATQYWTAFRDDFGAIHGEPISTVKVGELIPVPDRDDYVAVAIATATSSGQIVLRHTDTGWQIDFAATVGPALVGPLGEYLDSAISGDTEHIVHALAMDPLTGAVCTLKEIRDMASEMLEAERRWLPQFEGRRIEPRPTISIPAGTEAVKTEPDPAQAILKRFISLAEKKID